MSGEVQRGALRRTEVEKNFRHEIAGVADSALALGLGLLDKIVVGFLKQILKVDKMLEIFHR